MIEQISLELIRNHNLRSLLNFHFYDQIYRVKKDQYAVGGAFDKWLKTVKTCRSRLSCCPTAGNGNIIVRDFPTRSFTSSVVNKNFKNPSGDELKCELVAAQEEAEIEAGK